MARPQKNGLDYFALDVVMSDEVELIEAEHGLEGFAILIKMFQKIYSHGYYHEWDEKQQILFSNKVSSDRNLVTTVIYDCIKWGIFNKELYEKYSVLTSKRIQNHYISAVYKRVNVEIVQEYLLVDLPEKKNIELVDLNGRRIDNGNSGSNTVSDIGNEDANEVSDIQSTQSKVKESKGKESKRDIKTSCRKSKIYDEDSVHFQLANRLYQNILKNNPEHKKPNLQKWADDVRLMMERDTRTEDQITYLIDWVQDHTFWRKNILSINKLRDQFDRLVLEIKDQKEKVVSFQQKQKKPRAFQSLQDWAEEGST
ncbi:DUF4373 domain-containing protein [Bacillus sp. FJAT-45350]|uniref:DUF4373 domain-containing protein n=1 Tax=Bacillus sp. FJAT-45350 TaxID=2011014 RepID=UPI000BB7CCB0|nr:DUF4373 domain-containing protein [Bacillus sp. FJAT-45350]